MKAYIDFDEVISAIRVFQSAIEDCEHKINSAVDELEKEYCKGEKWGYEKAIEKLITLLNPETEEEYRVLCEVSQRKPKK